MTVPTRLVKDSDYELLPIGRDGKPLYPAHWGSDIPDLSKPQTTIRYGFRTSELPLSKVKEFRFAVRPIRTAAFPGVRLLPVATASRPAPAATSGTNSLRIGDITFYNGALPIARRMAGMKPPITAEQQRALAALRFAPGADRFRSGVAAEGLYVTGIQTDGTEASWDRNGNLLASGPHRRESRLTPGALRFQFDRIKLPGTGEWLDKNTYTTLRDGGALQGDYAHDGLETEFGIVGQPSRGLRTPGSATDYGNGYFNLIESFDGKPGTAANVDLYLSAGYGPWQTLVTSTRGLGAKNRPWQTDRAPIAGGGVAVLSAPVLKRNGAEVEVVARIPARFLARDANGRPLWTLRLDPTSMLSSSFAPVRVVQKDETPKGSPVGRLRFRYLSSALPRGGADSYRLIARPVETLYFRNVPTTPKAAGYVP